MVQEDVTPLPYIKFWSRTNCLKLASILGLNDVCTVWNIFWNTPGYIAWKCVDLFLSLKYYGSTIYKKGICICELQKVFCAWWACYVIVLLIEIWYWCSLSSEVLGKNTFLFSPESWQYVKKLLEKKMWSLVCKNSYRSLCIHVLGCPGRDAKYKVCKVDWYRHRFCSIHLMESLDMLIQARPRRSTKGM